MFASSSERYLGARYVENGEAIAKYTQCFNTIEYLYSYQVGRRCTVV